MIYNPRLLELRTPDQLRAELERVGAEPSSFDELIARGTFHLLKLCGISLALARLLYQELVMEGGQVVTSARLEHVGPGTTDVLLCGTGYQLTHLIVRLRWQASDELRVLADELEVTLENADQAAARTMSLGAARFNWGTRTHLMGIVNVTPDSFSHDGVIRAGDSPADYTARAVEAALQLVQEGADIIDIGGESTHPSAPPVDAATEKQRVVPVIEALVRRVGVPLSVDTYKAEVAESALEAGAHLVNDVWGLRRDSRMRGIVAATGAAVVVNHNWLGEERERTARNDAIGDIISELRAQVQYALEGGIGAGRIVVDPGLGFGKSVQENLEILDRLGELKSLGLPILIGPSRKGFIKRVVGAEDTATEQLDEGTAAAIALGIARGADIIRVHDLRSMLRVAKLADAVTRRHGEGEKGRHGDAATR